MCGVSAEREVRRDPASTAASERAAPSRPFRHRADHVRHAPGVEHGPAVVRVIHAARLAEHRQPERDGIGLRGMSQFVDEALHRERIARVQRGPPCTARHRRLDVAVGGAIVGDQAGREVVAVELGAHGRARRVAVSRRVGEMVLPRHDAAGTVHAAAQAVHARGPVEVMLDVVLARPHDLDRRGDGLGDERGLAGVVRLEPAPEATAAAGHVHRDAVRRNAGHARHDRSRVLGALRRQPELAPVAPHVRDAAQRFHGHVREERQFVRGLDPHRRRGKAGVHVAITTQLRAGRRHGGQHRLAQRAGARHLVRCGPRHRQRPPSLQGGPRGIGDDGDAMHHAERPTRGRDAHDVADAGYGTGAGLVDARDRTAERRTLHDRMEHPRHFDVDAVACLPGDDVVRIHRAHARAQQAKARRNLERDGLRRCGPTRGVGGELAIRQRAPARRVVYGAARRRKARDLDVPARCRFGNEQCARGRANLPETGPASHDGAAAAGELCASQRRVEIGLSHRHPIPVDVELLGDQHRQRGLHALPDLGIRRRDDHRSVDADLHPRVQRSGGDLSVERRAAVSVTKLVAVPVRPQLTRRPDPDQQPAAHRDAHADEVAPIHAAVRVCAHGRSWRWEGGAS